MRSKYLDINGSGLSVRCKLYAADASRTFQSVAVATYGFGGDKDNHPVEKFAEHLTSKYHGYAVLVFDWPAHGADGRKRLSAPESMTYLGIAADYARSELGAQHLFHYSTSYGGYIALRYLAEVGDPFEAVALRCPAIDLYHVMLRMFDQAELDKMARGKKVLKGYGRKAELDQEFLDDLRVHDVRSYEYFDHADSILLLHGTRDEQVPIEDTRAFADDNVIELVEVERADHAFSNPDSMDFAIGEAVKFFAPGAHASADG